GQPRSLRRPFPRNSLWSAVCSVCNAEGICMKTLRNSLAFAAICAVLFFGGGAVALAHGPQGTLSDRGYQEMRRLAERLAATARSAADQPGHQDSGVSRSDSRFVGAVSDFARRADRFNDRMANYRTARWQVDDELRSLLRNAQAARARARRSREADGHTVA